MLLRAPRILCIEEVLRIHFLNLILPAYAGKIRHTVLFLQTDQCGGGKPGSDVAETGLIHNPRFYGCRALCQRVPLTGCVLKVSDITIRHNTVRLVHLPIHVSNEYVCHFGFF